MSNFTQQDHHFMQRALRLAQKGRYTTSPNPQVGCVLVKNGEVVGEGYHQKAGQGHAEVHALAQAGYKAKGSTAYVTLEPCSHFGRTPPCAQALIDAGVKQVIAAMVDPNPSVSGRGIAMLNDAGVSAVTGLLAEDAKALNRGFIRLMTAKKPYVRCKLAASLDGKTAMANGESQWITSVQARQDVQRLRAQSCAIITSAESVIRDQAKMNVRWSELGELKSSYLAENIRQPIRVIIDSKNRLSPDLAVFEEESPIIIIRRSLDIEHKWPHFVEQVAVKTVAQHEKATSHICLPSLLSLLGKRGLNDVFIEAGANLAGAFINQNLVDELILYQAAKLIGAQGLSLVNLPDVEQLLQAKKLTFNEVTMVGPDIKIVAKLEHNQE